MLALAVSTDNSALFAGGSFANIGGFAIPSIAALNAATGAVDNAWNAPGANGAVNVIVVEPVSGDLIVGGSFTTVNGTARNRVAEIDVFGGLKTWNPNADSTVDALHLDGTTMYAGGLFGNVGGQPRNRLAAIDTETGNATSWNPDAGGQVLALGMSGGSVFAGGFFNSFAAAPRSNIAAIDTSTGAATSWNPGAPGGTVLALAISTDGTTLYVGGDFDTGGGPISIWGTGCEYLAALDTITDNATAWNPAAGAIVHSLLLNGTTLYAAGDFSGVNSIGGADRDRIAALRTDLNTNNATAWNPGASSTVWAMALDGTILYVCGDFNTIAGQARSKIAALQTDLNTNNATAWNPGAGSTVRALAVAGSNVFAGGDFSTLGGASRNNLGSVDTISGIATAWNPDPNSRVRALAHSPGRLDVGGSFVSVGPHALRGYAAFSSRTYQPAIARSSAGLAN